MSAEKNFQLESENESFSTDDLLTALPRVVVRNHRTYSFRLFPTIEKDKIVWNAMYRCDTNNEFINGKGESPRTAMIDVANLLLKQNLVVEIKTTITA